MLFEELNYEIQSNKQFKNNYISINGEPMKFTFSAVATTLHIDNSIESDFENGKFKNITVIKKLRSKAERKYDRDNNNRIFSELYKEAIRFKRDVCDIFFVFCILNHKCDLNSKSVFFDRL